MSGPILRQTVTITNPQGFHMRPAAAFASLASRFSCQVHVIKDDRRVDGKSILELFTLVALPNSEITIEVDGVDAHDALPALVDVVNSLTED